MEVYVPRLILTLPCVSLGVLWSSILSVLLAAFEFVSSIVEACLSSLLPSPIPVIVLLLQARCPILFVPFSPLAMVGQFPLFPAFAKPCWEGSLVTRSILSCPFSSPSPLPFPVGQRSEECGPGPVPFPGRNCALCRVLRPPDLFPHSPPFPVWHFTSPVSASLLVFFF